MAHARRSARLRARRVVADAGSVGAWRDYVASWTTWNHVRTAAALATSACLLWRTTE
ncbi:MAG: hypothetical protein KDE27_00630 [Planctomycetes bacterium]|nr:hypothetical protein [Planctomycetota bacterium]